MFNWLRAWLRRRKEARTRAIFEYWDGRNFRKIDPWRAHREVQADKLFSVEMHADAVGRGEEPETTNCLNCICRVFGVEKYNPKTGCGLIDGEILDLLGDLTVYLETLQKKTLPGPTSSENAAGESPQPPDSPSSITNSSSPLPSTPVEMTPAEGSVLPKESSTDLPV